MQNIHAGFLLGLFDYEDGSYLLPRNVCLFPPRYMVLILNTPWPEFASELHLQSDLRLSAKLVPTFADRGCHVFSAMDPYGRILDFLDQSATFYFK
jgi:hypothetical protein